MSVFIHIGQCGNQLGDAFWRLTEDALPIATSHSASASTRKPLGAAASASDAASAGLQRTSNNAASRRAGAAATTLPVLYREQFYHAQTAKARCIMVDTEPKVIRALTAWHNGSGRRGGANGVQRAPFEPAHVHFEQSGRGNNWAMGYNFQTHQRNVVPSKSEGLSGLSYSSGRKGKRKVVGALAGGDLLGEGKRELLEMVMDSLQREIEALDSYQGAVLMHSLGGGTGAGLGCRVMETIRDVYPRSYLTTLSIAPSCSTGDTPLQNYNAIFTLRHLQEHADCVIYKENDELLRSARYWKLVRDQAATGSASPRDVDDSGTSRQDKRVSIGELNALATADVAGYIFPIVSSGRATQGFNLGSLVHDCCPMPSTKFVDMRTGILRDRQPKIAVNGMKANHPDPLFHAMMKCLHAGQLDDDDKEHGGILNLARQTIQSFPRTTSSHAAISAAVVVRGATEAGIKPTRDLVRTLSDHLAAMLPQTHLVSERSGAHVAYSAMAPFACQSGRGSISVCVNNGHVRSSAKHFLDRSQSQFKAKAYTHWYKQYGLEDDDFEAAFQNCKNIIQEYDGMLTLD